MPTERQTALCAQLLERYGVLTREMIGGEKIAGGFSALYPVLKAMEEAGRIRRGYFVEGLGAAQFAAPGADDQLRNVKRDATTRVLAATDPACLYGSAIGWPSGGGERSPQRASGALVILREGKLIGYLSRTREILTTFVSKHQPDRDHEAIALAKALADLARPGRSMLLSKIDGAPATESEFKPLLEQVGFRWTSKGLLHRGPKDRPETTDA
jgi:ATP-dependent Lhr-like helicase